MSSVHVNLLPDVRQAKIRERRNRQLAAGIMTLVLVVCGALLALGFTAVGAQSLRIRGLTSSISSNTSKIEATPNLGDVLTAQAHLLSLGQLYDQRVRLTKFFSLLQSIAPTSNTLLLNSVGLDAGNTLTVQGASKGYAVAAKLAQAMIASNVTLGAGAKAGNTPDFSNVVLSALSEDASGKVAFTITAKMSSGVTDGK